MIESPESCSLLASNLPRPKSDESYLILVIEVFFCHSFHMMEASFSTIPRRIICGSSTFSIGSFSHFRSDTRNIYCCATFLFGQVAFPAWNAQIATEWQSLHDTDPMQLSMFFLKPWIITHRSLWFFRHLIMLLSTHNSTTHLRDR